MSSEPIKYMAMHNALVYIFYFGMDLPLYKSLLKNGEEKTAQLMNNLFFGPG